MSPEEHKKVVEVLRRTRGKTISNDPTGLPKQPDNDNKTPDGQYEDDGTSDPGVQHGVTGTGIGPIIGAG